MNPYQMPVVCSVCGGEGKARYGDGNEWLGDTFVHKNPMECKTNLEAKRCEIKIKQVAIKGESGIIYTLPRPARHHTIINMMSENGCSQAEGDIEGFLLDNGKFVDRIEAAKIALKNGQCEKLIAPPNLYSEDLW